MGVHLTFVALSAVSDHGSPTPISAVRSALANFGINLPDLEDGNHDIFLENPEWSTPHIGEDASFSIAGGDVAHIGIFRPSSPGIRTLCYELMASGFIMVSNDPQYFATSDALRAFPILSDKQKFPHGFIPIGGPDDFPWVTSGADSAGA